MKPTNPGYASEIAHFASCVYLFYLLSKKLKGVIISFHTAVVSGEKNHYCAPVFTIQIAVELKENKIWSLFKSDKARRDSGMIFTPE